MIPNNRTENFLGLIGGDADCSAVEPKTREEYYLNEIAGNIVPKITAIFETTVSPAATKCSEKFADLQKAVAAGKVIEARIKGQAAVLQLVKDGGAEGPMVWQGDVWGATFNASTGPASHTYYRCTLTKADVATIEST